MIITLNDFELNSRDSKFYLDEDVQGLSLPDIRTSSGVYSGRDGGYIGAQFYGMRQLSLVGRVFGQDVVEIEAKRRELQDALRTKAITMRVTTNAGHTYLIYCNLLKFDMPIKRTVTIAPFKIELLAADPIIYDDTNGAALQVTINKVLRGGYVYPVVYPVLWEAGALPTTVFNGGNTMVYPVITFTGSAHEPVLYNNTLGKLFRMEDFTMGIGDTLVVDMNPKARTVLLNGGSVFHKVSADSQFWGLDVGNNDLLLDTSDGNDTVSASVEWRSGYIGI
jgi:hypothetical protein